MDKETRRKQIKEKIIKIIELRESLRFDRTKLERELQFIKGNYDKTWEEEFTNPKESVGK